MKNSGKGCDSSSNYITILPGPARARSRRRASPSRSGGVGDRGDPGARRGGGEGEVREDVSVGDVSHMSAGGHGRRLLLLLLLDVVGGAGVDEGMSMGMGIEAV